MSKTNTDEQNVALEGFDALHQRGFGDLRMAQMVVERLAALAASGTDRWGALAPLAPRPPLIAPTEASPSPPA